MEIKNIVNRFNSTIIMYQLKRHQLSVTCYTESGANGIILQSRDDDDNVFTEDYLTVDSEYNAAVIAKQVAKRTHLPFKLEGSYA
ncbi:hypothetical protein [Lactobacillus phage Sabazios]|nr:hypothetical protein [Lactobacillus phage Silenus]AYH91880.1 hypothetical protein [Lactobacillus phage Sabazios]